MKLLCKILVAVATIAWFWPHPAFALDVKVNPASFTVARGQAYSKNLQYSFYEIDYSGPVSSVEGVFVDKNGATLRRSGTALSSVITSNVGRAAETLQIPSDVIEQAVSRRSNPFFFRRVFSTEASNGSGTDGIATVTFRIASEAAADFSVRRLELYFPNRRGVTTVQQYTEDLKAYAEVRFTGTGLLEGYWEVDGRTISTVKQYLTFGKVAILESPKAPILPTFSAGTHVVRFVIEKPAVLFNLPAIVYFVSPSGTPLERRLVVTKPEPGAGLPLASFELAWDRSEKAKFYVVEFSEDGRVIFSAMTPEPGYRVAQVVIDHYFTAGRSYQWRVRGFDDEGREIMESEERTLRLGEGG